MKPYTIEHLFQKECVNIRTDGGQPSDSKNAVVIRRPPHTKISENTLDANFEVTATLKTINTHQVSISDSQSGHDAKDHYATFFDPNDAIKEEELTMVEESKDEDEKKDIQI